jgi:tRNA dimethylallyltransferase
MRRLHADPRLRPGLPSMRAVGYRQGWQWLEGEFDAAEMRLKTLHATRQLAKRQLTWLRRETGCLWYDPTGDAALGGLMRAVERNLED